ncbi:hypothetical protein C8Z91_07090 [Paenibacillus elgii]|uniref:Uncharacterized protein n=1 Tax=Paenibacillus elgii TaxID=189691 RepID=A0A2T6G6Q0_9BACL|nr:hypothetical protein C8Z91_07090 [Paenibacillus elgii]
MARRQCAVKAALRKGIGRSYGMMGLVQAVNDFVGAAARGLEIDRIICRIIGRVDREQLRPALPGGRYG